MISSSGPTLRVAPLAFAIRIDDMIRLWIFSCQNPSAGEKLPGFVAGGPIKEFFFWNRKGEGPVPDVPFPIQRPLIQIACSDKLVRIGRLVQVDEGRTPGSYNLAWFFGSINC